MQWYDWLLIGIQTAHTVEYLDSLTFVMAWPDPIKNRRPRKPNSVQIAPLLHIVPDILNFVQKLKGLASGTPLATIHLDPLIGIDIKPVGLIRTKSHAMEPLLLYFWIISYIFTQCAWVQARFWDDDGSKQFGTEIQADAPQNYPPHNWVFVS